jgi:predicted metal-dependent hydrolase
MFPARFLVLAVAEDEYAEFRIRQLHMIKLIIRKLSYCHEIDFRSHDIKADIGRISGLYQILSIEKLEDEAQYICEISKQEYIDLIGETESCMNKERYWKAHTILENIWNIEKGDRKLCFQAIIWLLASMVHYQMGEPETAERMYIKARERLHNLGYVEIVNQIGMKFSYPCFLELSSLVP